MPVGRPTKYDPSWMLDKVIEVMKDGGSIAKICVELDINRDTFYEWLKDPEKAAFADTVKKGQMLSQVWWEDQGRLGLWTDKERSFNATTWIFNMTNRFGDDYKHKSESKNEHSGGVTINWPLGKSKLDE